MKYLRVISISNKQSTERCKLSISVNNCRRDPEGLIQWKDMIKYGKHRFSSHKVNGPWLNPDELVVKLCIMLTANAQQPLQTSAEKNEGELWYCIMLHHAGKAWAWTTVGRPYGTMIYHNAIRHTSTCIKQLNFGMTIATENSPWFAFRPVNTLHLAHGTNACKTRVAAGTLVVRLVMSHV